MERMLAKRRYRSEYVIILCLKNGENNMVIFMLVYALNGFRKLLTAYGGENCMFEGRGIKETVHYMCFSIF